MTTVLVLSSSLGGGMQGACVQRLAAAATSNVDVCIVAARRLFAIAKKVSYIFYTFRPMRLLLCFP